MDNSQLLRSRTKNIYGLLTFKKVEIIEKTDVTLQWTSIP